MLKYVPTIGRHDDGAILVTTTVEGVELDRPHVHGYVVRNAAMAERLAAAIAAGVVFYDAEVRTDVYGKTYLATRSHVLGRMMNADLRRLGF